MAESRPRTSPTRILSHLGVMGLVSVVFGIVVAGLAIPFAGVAGLAARDVSQSLDSLPAELQANELPQRTRVLDTNGEVIATLFDENRVNVPLAKISQTMREAIVSIEDYRFYSHGALDLKGTLRALITNQANSGVVQGGSSITQQMVKLTLLSQAETEAEMKAAQADTYERKLRELRYAIAFEDKYSKDWILERYLNIAYFGDGVFGIQAAARHYFGVNASKLNLTQSATLAGLVKNPTGYDPTNYPDRALERRNIVLDRMAELNVITQPQLEKSKAAGLGLTKIERTANGCVESPASWFCDYTLNYLLQDPQLGATVEDRRSLLYSGGLTIHTTVDLSYQQAADDSVTSQVSATEDAIGGLALVEPGTGNVKALAQSRPMGARKRAGETYLNYVVPKQYGDSNGFQPGSTFKTFVLATAIQQGYPLSTTIQSPPTIAMPFSSYTDCSGAPIGGGTWDVKNSTTSGMKNMYTGTRESVNTFFAQLEAKTGLCAPYKLAQSLGINLTDPATQMVPSFTLGVADVDALSMAAAYATFAGRGEFCVPRPVTKINDSSGAVVKNFPTQCRQALTESTADAVNEVLRGVQEPGGFGWDNGLAIPGHESAGKTGTTQDTKAVWFVGYTPTLAGAAFKAGVNDLGQPIGLGGSASGSGVAGPIWGNAMDAIADQIPDGSFTFPSSPETQGVSAPVPPVAGMTFDEARSTLEEAGFKVVDGGLTDSDQPRGNVASTYPTAGSNSFTGTAVRIYTSDGTPFNPNDEG